MALSGSPRPMDAEQLMSWPSRRRVNRSNLRILSLDGGGIRGLSSLMILEDIFDRLNARWKEINPTHEAIHPCDYFDIIGGTSTGGIIALMLGRLRMTIRECREEYCKLGEDVFVPLRGIGRSNRFDARKFEKVLMRIISRKLTSKGGVPGRKHAPLLDPLGENGCKVIVFTVSYVNTKPVSLRTYSSSYDESRNFTIWEAARATSAAPTSFERLVVPADEYSEWIDGGWSLNNPSEAILNEVERIWGVEHQQFDLNRVGIFLTLGTGVSGTVTLKGGFWNDLTNRLGVPEALIKGSVRSTFDTEAPHQRTLHRFNASADTSPKYCRFNVERGLREIDFYDYKRITEIREHTLSYLRDEETLQKLNNCVQQALEAFQDRSLELPRLISKQTLTGLIHILKEFPELLNPVEEYHNEQYFSHLTVRGMEVYDAIYNLLPKDEDGYVRLEDFVSRISSQGPTPEKLKDLWCRMRGGPEALMPRNLMLNILFMLHVECFDIRFLEHRPARSECGKWPMSEPRYRIAQSFGNWVECRFHDNNQWCGRSWNYANNQWGMCRGVDTDVECDLWLLHQAKLKGRKEKKGSYTIPGYLGKPEVAKLLRDKSAEKFLEHSQTFKAPKKAYLPVD